MLADQIIDSVIDINKMFEKDCLLKQLTKRPLEKSLNVKWIIILVIKNIKEVTPHPMLEMVIAQKVYP